MSWCANEFGYIDNGIIPKYAGCVNGVSWFKDRGQWLDGTVEPIAGMIIFFDWAASCRGFRSGRRPSCQWCQYPVPIRCVDRACQPVSLTIRTSEVSDLDYYTKGAVVMVADWG